MDYNMDYNLDYNLDFCDIYELNNKIIEKININEYNKIHMTYDIGNRFVKRNEEYHNIPILTKNNFLIDMIIFDKDITKKDNYITEKDNLQYYNIIIRNNNKNNKLFYDFTTLQNNNHILQVDSKTNLYIFSINVNLINYYSLCYDINKYNIDIDIYYKKNYNTFFNTYSLIAGYVYNEDDDIYAINTNYNLLYTILDCINKNYIDIQIFIIKIYDENINIVINKKISYKNFKINVKLIEKNQIIIIINKNIILSYEFYEIVLFIIDYFVNKYEVSKKVVICHLLFNKIDFDKINTYINYINDINDSLINNI
jgi:hypothetical protein